MPNAAQRILHDVSTLNPSGKTPLTAGVEQAAEVLDYKTDPGVVVLLTDGEETCDGAPCDLGKRLKAEGVQLTGHVIGFRMTAFWTGAQSALMSNVSPRKRAVSTSRRRIRKNSSRRSRRRSDAP